MKKLFRSLLKGFIVLFLTFLLIEGALAIFDPWGANYFFDLKAMFDQVVVTEQGIYVLPEGVHQFTHFSATMLPDSTRLVPDTTPREAADGTLVFIGDSITFGWGVNDKDTFANLIARDMPEFHVVNTGIPAFNSTYSIRRMNEFPDADQVVYLIFINDPETLPDVYQSVPKFSNYSWTTNYLIWLFALREHDRLQSQYTDAEYQHFEQELRELSADPRVTLFTFGLPEDDRTYEIAYTCCNAHPIPVLNAAQRVSLIDPHPNTAGHRVLADEMLAVLQRQAATSP